MCLHCHVLQSGFLRKVLCFLVRICEIGSNPHDLWVFLNSVTLKRHIFACGWGVWHSSWAITVGYVSYMTVFYVECRTKCTSVTQLSFLFFALSVKEWILNFSILFIVIHRRITSDVSIIPPNNNHNYQLIYSLFYNSYKKVSLPSNRQETIAWKKEITELKGRERVREKKKKHCSLS